MQYIFILVVLFLRTFCTSLWKRVNNSKEIVNIQDLLVLTFDYVDVATYQLKTYYYIIERIYFNDTLFIFLSAHCHSCCFYKQSQGIRV